VPDFHDDVAAWARLGLRVRDELGLAGAPVAGVGVPTWFYGQEPSNVFAGAIAKYFSNAEREDALLTRSDGGLVVLPGAAGTVQEVFQAATPQYYAPPGTVRPVVLVGVEHWTTVLPVWPLLQSLAAGREMAEHVHLVETADDAADLLRPAPREVSRPVSRPLS
jgi:predicted Rossmann-fold nucleotide-binding protein